MNSPASLAILERALGRKPAASETVDLPIDLAVLGGAAGPEAVQLFNAQGGAPWDPARVTLSFDFPAPGVEIRVPRSRTVCRDFALRHGLRHVFDLNMGIGAQILVEHGIVRPGQIVAGSGHCLHQVGALGALVLGAEPGILAKALAKGVLPFKVPEIAEVVFAGTPHEGFHAFDMALLAAQALAKFSANTIVEFNGAAVEHLSIDDRLTLVDVGAEAFRAGLVAGDGVTAQFLAERVETPPAEAPSGPRKGYAHSVTVSLDGSEPLVQGPGPGGPLRPVSELAGKKIHSAYIGSCAAGRASDLAMAAEILKRSKRIHADVRLTFSPTTLEVSRQCLTSGIYETFLQVGAMLAVPGSSPGIASGGALFGEGEVIISTAPCMSPMTDAGRGPEVYRASPATVAASAVAGEILDPDRL